GVTTDSNTVTMVDDMIVTTTATLVTTADVTTVTTAATTVQTDAPKTGVNGVGLPVALLAMAFGTAFAVRKKKEN
ncbi:MAG: NPXTG-anchored protein, partial [Ruminococcus sp.]|nr:NPXTG-anchored protein [Ruminococcus sp.]